MAVLELNDPVHEELISTLEDPSQIRDFINKTKKERPVKYQRKSPYTSSKRKEIVEKLLKNIQPEKLVDVISDDFELACYISDNISDSKKLDMITILKDTKTPKLDILAALVVKGDDKGSINPFGHRHREINKQCLFALNDTKQKRAVLKAALKKGILIKSKRNQNIIKDIIEDSFCDLCHLEGVELKKEDLKTQKANMTKIKNDAEKREGIERRNRIENSNRSKRKSRKRSK